MRRLLRNAAFIAAAGLLAYWPSAQAGGFYSGFSYVQPAPRAPGFGYYGNAIGNHQRGYGFNNRGQGFYNRGNHHRRGYNQRFRGHRWNHRGQRQPRFNGYSQGLYNTPGYHKRRYENFQRRHYNRLRQPNNRGYQR